MYKGFSLLELMLALLLSSFIFLSMTEVYYTVAIVAKDQEKIFMRIKAINITSFVLYHDIHRAGFVGCQARLPKAVQGDATHITVMRGETLLTLSTMEDRRHFSLPKRHALQVGDHINITDCMTRDTAQITEIHSGIVLDEVTLDHALSHRYAPSTFISRLISHTYFVRKGQGLYLQAITTQELVPGIDSLSIYYLENAVALTFTVDGLSIYRFIPVVGDV